MAVLILIFLASTLVLEVLAWRLVSKRLDVMSERIDLAQRRLDERR